MICQKCNKDFPENEVDESHDVPVYMFEGKDRRERKQLADKYGRHNLCLKCHKTYEGYVAGIMIKLVPRELKDKMINAADSFSKNYFKKEGENEN